MDFRSFLAKTLDDVGFRSSIADHYVWMRVATKPDGEAYYEYILCYMDDILCISHDAERPMKQIGNTMKFKGNKIIEPEFYLGARLKRKQLDNRYIWTMTSHDSHDYVKNAIANIEEQLNSNGMKLPTRVSTPMAAHYHPETDSSNELSSDGVTTFQECIGILAELTS